MGCVSARMTRIRRVWIWRSADDDLNSCEVAVGVMLCLDSSPNSIPDGNFAFYCYRDCTLVDTYS